jgi:hypothetical protein
MPRRRQRLDLPIGRKSEAGLHRWLTAALDSGVKEERGRFGDRVVLVKSRKNDRQEEGEE